jgi:hypothetical protein
MASTTYFKNQIMGNVFKTQTTPALPSQLWIGLSSATPTADGVDTGEPSTGGTGYTRVLLNNLSVPVNGVVTNTSPISFPESILSWGTMYTYTIRDAQSGGNLLIYNDLSVSRSVEPNTVITIKAGELKITLRDPA